MMQDLKRKRQWLILKPTVLKMKHPVTHLLPVKIIIKLQF